MPRRLFCLILLILFARPELAAGDTEPRRLPELSGYFLDGERVSIPEDLEAPVTLLIIGRERPGTEDFDRWQDIATELQADMPSIFVVLMGDRNRFGRAVSAGRLRREVHTAQLSSSLVPVFQDEREINARLGLRASVSALLVNEAGEITWQKDGPAEASTPAEIKRVMGRRSQQALLPAEGTAPALRAIEVTGPASPEPEADAAITAPADETEASAPGLPALQGITLAGRKLHLPDDLSQTGTQLLLVPDHEGLSELEPLLAQMENRSSDNWMVLVFRGDAPRFGRAFAAGELRARIETKAWHDHVLPVYMPLAEFERRAGLSPASGPRLFSVSNTGSISQTPCTDALC